MKGKVAGRSSVWCYSISVHLSIDRLQVATWTRMVGRQEQECACLGRPSWKYRVLTAVSVCEAY